MCSGSTTVTALHLNSSLTLTLSWFFCFCYFFVSSFQYLSHHYQHHHHLLLAAYLLPVPFCPAASSSPITHHHPRPHYTPPSVRPSARPPIYPSVHTPAIPPVAITLTDISFTARARGDRYNYISAAFSSIQPTLLCSFHRRVTRLKRPSQNRVARGRLHVCARLHGKNKKKRQKSAGRPPSKPAIDRFPLPLNYYGSTTLLRLAYHSLLVSDELAFPCAHLGYSSWANTATQRTSIYHLKPLETFRRQQYTQYEGTQHNFAPPVPTTDATYLSAFLQVRHKTRMPSSQRPFFLSSFLAAFRPQQPASSLSAAASSHSNKHHGHSHSHSHASPSTSPSGSRSLATTSQAQTSASSSSPSGSTSAAVAASSPQSTPHQRSHHHHHHGGGAGLAPYSPRTAATTTHSAIPIPDGRRRGSDSSSEGFRDVLGGEKWYIGGRTAGGEERFFKLGVVRRARSQDRLSLDRLSL